MLRRTSLLIGLGSAGGAVLAVLFFSLAHSIAVSGDQQVWESHLSRDITIFMWIMGLSLTTIGALVLIIFNRVRQDLDGKRTIRVCEEIGKGHCILIENAQQEAEEARAEAQFWRNDLKKEVGAMNEGLTASIHEVKDWAQIKMDRFEQLVEENSELMNKESAIWERIRASKADRFELAGMTREIGDIHTLLRDLVKKVIGGS